MNRLVISDQTQLDRWTKAALQELSPQQKRWVRSMQWSGFTISKARMSGSQNDLVITLERTAVLLTAIDTDDPKAIGISEEMREHIITQKGNVSKGRKQFRWRREA